MFEALNDQLDWLYEEMDLLLPSLYGMGESNQGSHANSLSRSLCPKRPGPCGPVFSCRGVHPHVSLLCNENCIGLVQNMGQL
jgi:hypothetical protein